MMVADDERGARRHVPVLSIAQDQLNVSTDLHHDDDGDNDEEALAPAPSESSSGLRRMRWCTPMYVVYALLAICAVAGAVVGVVITVQYNNLDDNEPSRTDFAKPDNSTTDGDGGAAAKPTASPTLPAPASPPVVVRLFALGSWGADPSFGAKLDGRYRYQDKIDRSAQVEVASSMAFAAREGPPPQLIVTQGNNFNWYGLLPPSNQERSVQARVNETFTSKYNQLSLAAVPWTAIMGEHDVGGGRFLCGSTEATLHACGNENELIAGLRHKMASQQSEPPSGGRAQAIRGTQKKQHAKPKKIQHSHDEGTVSTGTIQDPRWTMKDQYYKQRLVSKDGQVTVDVFHVNVLVGSARSICCQCIGYAHPTRAATACTSISARDDYCAGGNYAFYKACSGELRAMADASYTKFKADVAVSNATFKIVNGHVSPWAMDSSDRLKWIDATAQGRVHLWLHATNPTMTHVEALPSARRLKERHTKRISKHSKHVDHVKGSDDASNGDDGFASHFMTNGVGGGIPIQVLDGTQAANQESAKVVWTLDERKYGFLDILATATSLRVLLRATGNTVLYCVDIDRDTGDDVKCKLE